MSNLGPQQFDIPIGDQLFPTLNPSDPIVGIAPSALVPVNIPWNLQRTELTKGKEVAFGPIRWSGAGTGPHDVHAGKIIGGPRQKIGTVSWSIATVCYQSIQTNGGNHRWLITPCPILSRTFTPLQGAPQTTEITKNPQPCPGNWVKTPSGVSAAIAHSLKLTTATSAAVKSRTRKTKG